MAFKLPMFPSRLAIWHPPNVPPALPDLISPCQLTPGRRAITPAYPRPAGAVIPAIEHVLLPRGTDIRDGKAATGADLVECPVGSGRMYDAVFVDDIGFGFSNEHRFAQLRGIPTWPVPFPGSRYPPGLTATVIGSGGTGGIAIGNFLFSIVAPFDGVFFLIAADYNGGVPPGAASCGMVTLLPSIVSPLLAVLGQTAYTAIWIFPVVAGHYDCQIRSFFGTDVYQYQAVFVTGSSLGTIDVNAIAMGAGAPAIVGPAGQSNPADIMLAPFARIGAAGASGFGFGFTNTGFDVTDLIGGNVCVLSVGTLNTTAIGIYPVIIPAALDAGWTGMNAAFF